MLLTRTEPLELPIFAMPGQVIICQFKTGGDKNVKINVDYHVYTRGGGVVNSGIVSVFTGGGGGDGGDEEKTHTIKMISPTFREMNVVKSVVYISMNTFNKVDIKDAVVALDQDFERRRREILFGEGRDLGGGEVDLFEIFGIGISPIDKMLNEVKIRDDLGMDSKNRLFYMRPWANDSFGLVSHNHIKYMRENLENLSMAGMAGGMTGSLFEIVDLDWPELGNIGGWTEKRSLLLHPFLYPFASPSNYHKNISNFVKILRMKHRLGGFDVADSDRISGMAVSLINKLDLIMVPSEFAKDSYIRSGVRSDIVQVLHHGVADEMLKEEVGGDTRNVDILRLRELKRAGNILILFFLVHSEWRKGADLVKEVMKRIQRGVVSGVGRDVLLVVKGPGDISRGFLGVRGIGIGGWMDERDLRMLYDTCDILISPSRGGGFELNALEGVSRGLPTLVTNGGCFKDYMRWCIPIEVKRMVQPLPGNPVHVGMGFECDIDDFSRKLEDVIVRLDEHKKGFRNNMIEFRRGGEYTWKNVALKLEEYLRKYDFVK